MLHYGQTHTNFYNLTELIHCRSKNFQSFHSSHVLSLFQSLLYTLISWHKYKKLFFNSHKNKGFSSQKKFPAIKIKTQLLNYTCMNIWSESVNRISMFFPKLLKMLNLLSKYSPNFFVVVVLVNFYLLIIRLLLHVTSKVRNVVGSNQKKKKKIYIYIYICVCVLTYQW